MRARSVRISWGGPSVWTNLAGSELHPTAPATDLPELACGKDGVRCCPCRPCRPHLLLSAPLSLTCSIPLPHLLHAPFSLGLDRHARTPPRTVEACLVEGFPKDCNPAAEREAAREALTKHIHGVVAANYKALSDELER